MNMVHFPTPVPGTEAIYAVQADYPAPVGYIYYRNVLTHHCDILHCFVQPFLRRQGILTKMFSQLKVWYPEATFITQSATAESEPWLIKMGFEKRSDGWWLLPSEP